MELLTLIEVLQLNGLVFSTLGLILQIVIYVLVPCSRQLDLKLMTQLTVARLLRVVAEYLIRHAGLSIKLSRYLAHLMYSHTETALACWMVIFTKHLYDKFINVFVREFNFTALSVIIWTVTFVTSPWIPVIMYLEDSNKIDKELKVFRRACEAYSGVKFIILMGNLLLLCKIFAFAIRRTDSLVKTCVIFVILLSISSVHTMVEMCIMHLHNFFSFDLFAVWVITCLINAYQIVIITGIFVMLVQNVCEEALFKTIANKFRNISTSIV